MAKSDKFYFENFAASTALSQEAAVYLVNCLEKYDSDNIEHMLEEMHNIEHRADIKKHEMNAALAKAFVTPVDREDLDMLSHQIDDITDEIEEVLQCFYINNIKTVQPKAIEFAKLLVKSCNLICELIGEFENFKKSKKIKDLIIALNDTEDECDKLYLSSMRALAINPTDTISFVAWRDIYKHMEACADTCEHIGDCMGMVIMKNT